MIFESFQERESYLNRRFMIGVFHSGKFGIFEENKDIGERFLDHKQALKRLEELKMQHLDRCIKMKYKVDEFIKEFSKEG